MPRELRALVVGIDEYPFKPLTGSVSDAKRMASVLRQHGTQEPNFAVKLLTAPMKKVTEST
ncbi:MAG: caspase family protein, partial [Gammaproteobacteria bacterium]|nr:caspase family protein [Gammaproteobacteria bacterium]